MREFKSNSYKRYYIAGLAALLVMVIIGICGYLDKRVYKVYIQNRLVGITSESPEVIEKTYNQVKAKRYAQGADIIKEDIKITEESMGSNQQLVDREELAKRLYVELSEPELAIVTNMTPGKIVEKQFPMETIYVEDSALYVGESRVLSEGREETRKFVVKNVWREDGSSSQLIVENVVEEADQPRVIAIGVKERPAYIVPVDDYVLTSCFGPRWGREHQGVDLAVASGTQVHAAADGVIVQSGWNGGYGISIYVDHGNGIITRYGHLSQAYAQVGRQVKQGEVIGLSGNTGNSTGPHLHFEIRIGDVAVNPESYIDIEY